MDEEFKTEISKEAKEKLMSLLDCGNERVELAAAKELVALFGKTAEEENEIKLEVTITIKD